MLVKSSWISFGPNGQECSRRAQIKKAAMPAAVQISMIRMADQPEAWKMYTQPIRASTLGTG